MSQGYKLVYVWNEESDSEYVVILSPEGDLNEIIDNIGGGEVKETIEIAGDCSSLPCDRPLSE